MIQSQRFLLKLENKRGEHNPDMFTSGVAYCDTDKNMDQLMLFLASFANNMHYDRDFTNVLTLNKGIDLMDE